jgi:hypothetical protein
LREYQNRFQSAALEEEKATTMFLDHRIRFEPFQQQALLHYLDESVNSASEEESMNSSADAEAVPSVITTAESCTEYFRKLIQSSPNATQDDLLSLYTADAPSRLQFSRSADLVELLRLVATEEGSPPRWSLRHAKYDGRDRSKRRARRNMGQPRLVVDEALVEIGQTIESRWFEWPRL